jgi:hypothetical protein
VTLPDVCIRLHHLSIIHRIPEQAEYVQVTKEKLKKKKRERETDPDLVSQAKQNSVVCTSA